MGQAGNTSTQESLGCGSYHLRCFYLVCQSVHKPLTFDRVGSSVAIQAIFADASFDKPLFLTYFSTTLFSVYLLGLPIIPRWRRSITGKISQTQQQEDESTSSSSSQDFLAEQEVAIDFRKVKRT